MDSEAQAMVDADVFYIALAATVDEDSFACDDYGDPSNYLHETTGKIFMRSAEDETSLEIGSFAVVQVDVDGAIAQGVSVHDVFDQTQGTYNYLAALVDTKDWTGWKDVVLSALDAEDESVPMGLLIIDDVQLNPKYRGRDFGLTAIKALIQRFRMGAGLVVMRPFPLQFDEGLSAREREELQLGAYRGNQATCVMKLRAHCSILGFRLLPETDGVMALLATREVPNIETP